MSFPVFDLRGPPRELGRQHGEALRHRIERYVDVLLDQMAVGGRSMSAQLGARPFQGGRPELLAAVAPFERIFADYAPTVLDEVRGVAEGAGITLAEALLCNVRGDVLRTIDFGCTAIALGRGATAQGEVLLAQTMDSHPGLEELCVILRLTPRERPPLVMYTYAGCVGYIGVNAAGASNCTNSLDVGTRRMGVPHYPMKRLLLETTTVAEGIALMEKTSVASAGNYVMADGEGSIADVELTPAGACVTHGTTYLVHTNHLVCGDHRDLGAGTFPDSIPRFERATALVTADLGRHSAATLQALLRDHVNAPTSICRHLRETASGPDDGDLKTITGLVIEPERGLLHVAAGNPCATSFETHAVP